MATPYSPHTTVRYTGDTDFDDILTDDSASFWLKRAITEARHRDPIDAANDAEFLCSLLTSRAAKILTE